jgi:hypothetical protein
MGHGEQKGFPNSQTGTPIGSSPELSYSGPFQVYLYEKGGLALGELTQL